MADREASRGLKPVVVLGALGVVFGDIGTSPLYAMRTVLGEDDSLDTHAVYGLTSMVVWALILVVTVLYVGLLLRTDNEGEGGLLALVALLRRTTSGARAAVAVSILGMVGAAMFLGDSVITPAISVLSAAEGLEEISPSTSTFVLPIALVLLVGVFALQHLGSGTIGRLYGPIMLTWFVVLAGVGVGSLAQDPSAARALSPTWAVRFAIEDPLTAFLALGAVVLAVTGAEALYADLGHFGRPAITWGWLAVVLPALLVSYLGEASAVVRDPGAAADPFFAVVPSWATVPVVVLATAATVIASQAVISGGFTVLHQAAGLGLFPFLRTEHTSRTEGAQIYLPAANWVLAAAVLGVAVGFRSSDRLAAAYGVAVTVTIVVTVSLFLALQRARRHRVTAQQALAALLMVVVLAFFAAAVPKILQGGWLPVGIGGVLVVLMSSWRSGQARLAVARRARELSVEDLLAGVSAADLRRPGASAVFLTYDSSIAPLALRTVVQAGQTLPRLVVLLSWHLEDTPRAPARETAVRVRRLAGEVAGVLSVDVTLGYRERLDVVAVLRRALEQCPDELADLDPDTAWYVTSDAIPRLTRDPAMARWRQRVFLVMDRLATDRVDQLRLPRDRTITVGRELEL